MPAAVAEVPFRLEGDNGSGGGSGYHYVGRIHAQCFGVVDNECGGAVKVFYSNLDGVVDDVDIFHAHVTCAFEAEPVVYCYYAVAVLIVEPEPGEVLLCVAVSHDEAASEYEKDGRFLLAVDGGDAAFCRLINRHEKLAGVPLGEKVFSGRGDVDAHPLLGIGKD